MNNFKFQVIIIFLITALGAVVIKIGKDDSSKNSFDKGIKDSSLATSVEFPSSLSSDNINKIAVSAKILFVCDLEKDVELFNLNKNDRWPIASLTKLMTAVIAVEKIGYDKKISINEEANSVEDPNGNLVVGEVYTVKDLIKAMLVVSSNNAAEAIADFYGNKNFVDEMQKKASDLGMFQMTFVDATGLSFLNQSNADNLKLLVGYIFKNHPDLLDISKENAVELTEVNSGDKKTLKNINYFAGRNDFLGGKTGFNDFSKGNLVSVFQYLNRKILIITLGADDRFKETEAALNFIKEKYFK